MSASDWPDCYPRHYESRSITGLMSFSELFDLVYKLEQQVDRAEERRRAARQGIVSARRTIKALEVEIDALTVEAEHQRSQIDEFRSLIGTDPIGVTPASVADYIDSLRAEAYALRRSSG